MQICVRCNLPKEESEFGKRRKDCKLCRNSTARQYYENNRESILSKQQKSVRAKQKHWKRYDLRRKFNLSLEDFSSMQTAQNNQCAVCHIETALAVDHDHSTGVIRGLLCRNCNLALGLAKDNVQTLLNMVEYLRKGAGVGLTA